MVAVGPRIQISLASRPCSVKALASVLKAKASRTEYIVNHHPTWSRSTETGLSSSITSSPIYCRSSRVCLQYVKSILSAVLLSAEGHIVRPGPYCRPLAILGALTPTADRWANPMRRRIRAHYTALLEWATVGSAPVVNWSIFDTFSAPGDR